jgi:hypothetical protein
MALQRHGYAMEFAREREGRSIGFAHWHTGNTARQAGREAIGGPRPGDFDLADRFAVDEKLRPYSVFPGPQDLHLGASDPGWDPCTEDMRHRFGEEVLVS